MLRATVNAATSPWALRSSGSRPIPLPNRVGGCAERDGLAVAEDAAGITAIGAGQHARQLGPARAEQPGNPDHFTGAQAETDVVQRARAAEALDLQQLLARCHAALGKVLLRSRLAISRTSSSTVTSDNSLVAMCLPSRSTVTRLPDAIHLVQAMRDVDHRDAARDQPRDQRKQLIDFT